MPLLSYSDFLYQVRVYDNASNLVGLYDDLVSLYYQKTVNHPGLAVLTVPETHPMIAQLADDLLIEVFFIYRPLTGGEVTDVQDFIGLYRDKQVATDVDGNVHYLLYFPGTIEILSRNIIAFRPGFNTKTKWTATMFSLIAGYIVSYNSVATTATTAYGRLRNSSIIRNLSLGALVTTPTIDYSVSYRNVLDVLQELAVAGGFDFDIIRPSTISTDLQFKTYLGQLGDDLRSTIIFDLNLDNTIAANLNGERLRERTVAIVGGSDIGSSRNFAISTGVNQSASNDYEVFVDARDKATSELGAIGNARLSELEARINIDVDIAPSSGYVYRRDYKLGDLVTASFAGTMLTKKISTVEVKFDQDQNTSIRIELENP